MGDNQIQTTSQTGSSNPMVNKTLEELLGGVSDAWKTGPSTFGESLYGGVGNTTRQGWNSALTAARNPAFTAGSQGAMNYTNRLIGNGGLTGRAPGGGAGYGGSSTSQITHSTPMVPPAPGDPAYRSSPMTPQAGGPQAGVGPEFDSTGQPRVNPLTDNTSVYQPPSDQPGNPDRDNPYPPPAYYDPGQTPQTQFADPLSGYDPNYGAGSVTADGGQWGDLQTTRNIGDQFGRMAEEQRVPGLYESTMMGTARGDNLNGADPYFQSNLTRTLDEAGAGVTSAIGAGGRFGSGAHVSQLGRTLGSISDTARSNEYNRSLARQQEALAGIGGERQTRFGNEAGARTAQAGQAGTAFGMEQQGVANQMGLGSSLAGQYASSLLPSQTYGMVGSAQDADTQANLLGRNDFYRRQKDGKTDLLAKLSSILSGTAGVGGTTTTNTQPGTPWWMTGASLLGQFI